ncbi:uncharacterized protein Hap1MRO34_010781 isoform 1-T2 [Clarias gariepinus]
MLSRKSDQEIVWMLDDYGIKHGPVVGSTRLLYEKKLRDVMAKERKTRGAPERVGYRQHYAEDVHQRRSWGHYSGDREEGVVSEPMVSPYYAVSQGRYTAVRQERSQERSQERTQERTQFVPLWLQIVFFLIVVCVLVFVFISMESAHSEPFTRLT